jgi:uncharacterized protein (DUF2062 family)
MKRLVALIRKLVTEGLSPQKISWAVALGITLGIHPIYGPVTLIALGLAFLLRLNKALVLAACYAMAFIKPMLILPYLKLGEWLFRADPMPISLVQLSARFAAAPVGTLQEFAWSFLHAFVGWLVTVPLLLGGVYLVMMAVIRRREDSGAAAAAAAPAG